jgi:hypothetical protein
MEDAMGRRDAKVGLGILIALLFSLVYVGLFPMLTGRSVIYAYPYWPVPLAIAYVGGGILLQAGFCYFREDTVALGGLVVQTLTGVGYLVVALFAGGGLYMS